MPIPCDFPELIDTGSRGPFPQGPLLVFLFPGLFDLTAQYRQNPTPAPPCVPDSSLFLSPFKDATDPLALPTPPAGNLGHTLRHYRSQPPPPSPPFMWPFCRSAT